MRLNNRLTLAACLVVTGCVGGGDRPDLVAPTSDGPQSSYSQPYPQGGPQADSPSDAPDAAPMPSRPTPAPLGADEMNAAPPASSGPSGTSGRGVDRYDEVGYATWYGEEMAGGRTASGAVFDPKGFTAAHRTLPLGSYAEVTSLDTGRTILVLINDRGPQPQNLLIDLSQGAAQALGIQGRAAVRIRRVNPTTSDLAAIRAGQPGAPRLDTPPGVLAGLRQRIGGPQPVAPVAKPPRRPSPEPQAARPAPRPAPAPGKVAEASNGYYVQVAAFSNQARAAALAKSLNGSVAASGSVFRVRLGPYSSPEKAAQARDAAAARGYGDARVVRDN